MNFATTILADVLAIFFASRLLDCKFAKLKWVLQLVIILHSLSLLVCAFNWAMYSYDESMYRDSSVFVYQNSNSPKPVNRGTLTLIGVMSLALLALSIFLLFIDFYFLYTLFVCDTTSFVIYMLVLLLNVFTATQRVVWHKSCVRVYE